MRRLELLAAFSAVITSGSPGSRPSAPKVREAIASSNQTAVHAPTAQPLRMPPWRDALRPLRFAEVRTRTAVTVELYRRDGAIDDNAALAIDRVAAAASGDALPPPMNRRLLQLVVKAATHFHAGEVNIVSTFRASARAGSKHRMGEAMDFSLPGVSAAKLAAHLRGYGRVGVGVYTNPRTQFVHLDVRDASYHWADASPPGRTWRESRMTDRGAIARDAAYSPEHDLPELLTPVVPHW